jgi:hypothetical protein
MLTTRQQIANARDGHVYRIVHDGVGPAALLFLIVIGFFWKITLTSQFTFLESPDLANQVLPWQQAQAAAFHSGQFPAWDPYLWGGQSLIGQAQPGTAYPLNWILYSLPLKEGHIRRSYLHWYFALLHVLAAWFCYWLCRDLGRSRMASLLGGTAFALSGVVGTIDWPQMLNGAIWAPLVLMFLLRAVRGEHAVFSAALAGFFHGVSWLSGHHQIPIFMTLAMAGVWAFYLFRGGKVNWKVLALAGVFGVFLALTSALQVLPAYEYGQLARRWVGAPEPLEWKDAVPYTVHQEHGLGLFTLFGLVVPGIHKEADPYVGFVILSLAALGVALGWSDIHVRVLATLALAGLFLSLGHQNIFHGLLYAVLPVFEKARTPAMAAVVFNFGVAVLAAYGFDGLREHHESAWPRRIALWLASMGTVMLILMLGVMISKQLGFDYDDRIVLVAVLGLLFAALYLGYHKRNLSITSLGVCCLLLLLMDLGNSTGYAYVHRLDKNRAIHLNKFSENQDILQWLRRQPGRFRIQVDSKEIPFNYGDWYGLEVFDGYVASMPASLMRLGHADERTAMLYGVKYWIGRRPRSADHVDVFTAKSGLKIYQSPTAFPRVWSVHRAMAIASENQVSPTIQDPGFDLLHAAFFLGETPKLSACAGEDQTTLVGSDFNSVVIQAHMQCRGLVVLSDNYYPGWTATVDGQTARMWEAYTAIRGVEVEAGTHRIEMHYRPLSVRLGALMLLLSVLGLAGLAWWDGTRVPAPI